MSTTTDLSDQSELSELLYKRGEEILDDLVASMSKVDFLALELAMERRFDFQGQWDFIHWQNKSRASANDDID